MLGRKTAVTMKSYQETAVSETGLPAKHLQAVDFQQESLAGRVEISPGDAGQAGFGRSLAALARALGNERTPDSRRPDGRLTAPVAITAATVLLLLLLALWPARTHSPALRAASWEPLATYGYESRVPIPPLPFPEGQAGADAAPGANAPGN